MAQKFNTGDVVSLKSGGTKWTVSGYKKVSNLAGPDYVKEGETRVEVLQEVSRGKIVRDTFEEDTIELSNN